VIAASSNTTWRLVTKNNRPSRAKKKPVAPVSVWLPSMVETRVTASNKDSIKIALLKSPARNFAAAG